MNWVRDKLSSIGIFLVLAGVISSALQLFGRELRIFRFIDARGPVVAWGIRLGCVALGVALFFLADRGEKARAQDDWSSYRAQALADPRVQGFFALLRDRFAVAGPEVVHLVLVGHQGEILPPSDPRVAFVRAYVSGQSGRFQVTQALATGELQRIDLTPEHWAANVPS